MDRRIQYGIGRPTRAEFNTSLCASSSLHRSPILQSTDEVEPLVNSLPRLRLNRDRPVRHQPRRRLQQLFPDKSGEQPVLGLDEPAGYSFVLVNDDRPSTGVRFDPLDGTMGPSRTREALEKPSIERMRSTSPPSSGLSKVSGVPRPARYALK